MKIKTSELTGRALDWVVAEMEGLRPDFSQQYYGSFATGKEHSGCSEGKPYSPSTDWEQGGPLIERERVEIVPWNEPPGVEDWAARTFPRPSLDPSKESRGHTALIAAMRAIVAAKLGEEVDVPEELGKL